MRETTSYETIGAMPEKHCDLCGRATQHNDQGECAEHEVIARRTPAPARQFGWLHRYRGLVACAIAVLAVWLYGAIHIVYGDGLGLASCWKTGWSFSDTFIDVADLRGDATTPTKILLALEQCKIVPDKGAWERDKVLLLTAAIAIGGAVVWRFLTKQRPHRDQ